MIDVAVRMSVPVNVARVWARALDLAVAAGIPRDVLDGISLTYCRTAMRSCAGGRGVYLAGGRPPLPAYLLSGDLAEHATVADPDRDLLEVLLHELGHCIERAGCTYYTVDGIRSPPAPARAAAFLAAETAWQEPWSRTRVGSRIREPIDGMPALDGLRGLAAHEAWWAAARVHPDLAAAYLEIDPASAYGATDEGEDFAEAFVLWTGTGAGLAALTPTLAGRVRRWRELALAP